MPTEGRKPRPTRALSVALCLLSLVLAAGCGPVRLPAAPEAGAVLTPPEVLRLHNEWADSVKHLWARADLRLNFPRGQGSENRRQFDIEGHLFLEKPDNFLLHGQVLGQEMFQLGTNADRYWLWIRPDVNLVWYGHRGGPGEKRLIVAPTDLMITLGVFPVEPAPENSALFVIQKKHYIFSEARVVEGEKVPVRRIWFDRRTLRPLRIDLFDESGHRVLMAELLRYERIGSADVCTVYRVRSFRDEEVDMVIQLSAASLEKKISPKVFEYRTPPGATERDLDEVEAPAARDKPGP